MDRRKTQTARVLALRAEITQTIYSNSGETRLSNDFEGEFPGQKKK